MPASCSVVAFERRPTAVIRAEAAFAKLPEVQRTARARLAKVLPSLDAGAAGPDCTRWRLLEGGGLAMEIGRVVARARLRRGGRSSAVRAAGRPRRASVDGGGFENLPLAWQTLFDWRKAGKLSPAGINWEIYGATEDAELYVLLA